MHQLSDVSHVCHGAAMLCHPHHDHCGQAKELVNYEACETEGLNG